MGVFSRLHRSTLARAAQRAIVGEDPMKRSHIADRQQQRELVAEIVTNLLKGGMAPEVLIEMLIAGAAWLGDNFGVSRQQMGDFLRDVKLGAERSLIWTPPSHGTPDGEAG